ncbi:MAG: ATP-binding protein [Clostridia bacterium]
MKKIAATLLTFSVIFIILVPCYAADKNISWTDEELTFMNRHPVIRVGVDEGFVPFEFIGDTGEHKGIAADYLSLISEITGLTFEVVIGDNWSETYEMALAGEVDLLAAIGKTPEREKNFLFSDPYCFFKRVIVTRETDTDITDMKDLEGLTVAVQRGSSHHSYLLSYPKINLSLYDTAEAALSAVATGSEKAHIGNLTSVNYLAHLNGLTNLRYVAFEAEKQQAIHMAVNKKFPELVGILNKALQAIPEKERLAINSEWMDLDNKIDYGPIIRIVTIFGAVVVVALFVSFFWVIRLKKEIKQRKQIQADLEIEKQKSDEANEFKSIFLARMSHEIRTPLNAITGMSYLLKKTDLSVTQRMYIDCIVQASNHMLSIINDILDFSKIEAGKVEPDVASFSLDHLIQDVVNIVSYKIEEQNIAFHLVKEPNVPNWFFGDSKRIEQILLNILNNAVKFTNAGEVSLSVRLVAKENDIHYISFTVKDTGIGMTEEQISRLFKPFVQVDSSISRRFGGTGLGLTIVKSLVDLMGGEIKVFSTPNEGSTFIIRLPLTVDGEKEELSAKTMSGKSLEDFKTLVLEKITESIPVIEGYLKGFGMQSEFTGSESSAMSILEGANNKRNGAFDLLIIDVNTAAEETFRFVEAIKRNSKIIYPPKILVFLPMNRVDLFERLDKHGIDMGISKPIIPSVLLNGILDVLKLREMPKTSVSLREEDDSHKPLKSYYILLAEDNKTNRMMVTSLLQKEGIECIIAEDGKEAVEQFKQHQEKIKLVLMDLHMPVMNGYEASREIRKMSEDIPIVAMTADVIPGVREKCAECGIRHYISKPLNPERFIQMMKEMVIEKDEAVTEDIRVLDQAAGLRNMGEDKSLYLQVLNEYYHENQDTTGKIGLALKEKRYKDAAQMAHKIKSSTGSIGAKSLYDVAAALQKAIQNEKMEEVKPLYDRFALYLSKLLEEIKGIQI